MKLDTLHAQLDFTLNGLHWLLNEKSRAGIQHAAQLRYLLVSLTA